MCCGMKDLVHDERFLLDCSSPPRYTSRALYIEIKESYPLLSIEVIETFA
jgi:hypothetical protein